MFYERWLKRFFNLQKSTQLTILLGLGAGIILLLSFMLETPGNSPEEQTMLSVGVDVAIKLAIVLLSIYLVAFILRKLGLINSLTKEETSVLKVRESLPLSPRRTLYLVQVGRQSLLIGATDQNISLLAEINSPENQDIELKDITFG